MAIWTLRKPDSRAMSNGNKLVREDCIRRLSRIYITCVAFAHNNKLHIPPDSFISHTHILRSLMEREQ